MATAHYVKCCICGKTFNRDKVDCVMVGSRRYAHTECSQTEEEKKTKEQKDREALEAYINNLFGTTTISAKVKRQIKKYIEEEHFTYSGILGALKYFYEIKGGDLAKANGGIGIVGFIYQDAHNYYRALWEAQEINSDKDISLFIPKNEIKEVKIKPPKRETMLKRVFTFLDKE